MNRQATSLSHHEHKVANAIKSLKWLIFWVCLALAFNIGIFFVEGQAKAEEFLAGYLTELSLSIDNVFVFLMIFQTYQIKEHAQHRVLSWGIIGAIVLRFFFIFFGVALVTNFKWMLWIFGAFLIIQGVRMTLPEKESDPNQSFIMRNIRRVFPVTDTLRGEKFFVVEDGRRFITPLFAVLILIESSDILFAIDSVPAVLSISTDLFIVYTSNIFAILGLRQLFFVIEHASERFEYVRYGVAIILAFTGVKMLSGIVGFHIPTNFSICFIAGILFASIVISFFVSKLKMRK